MEGNHLGTPPVHGEGAVIAPTEPVFPHVRRILVLRAGGLGDLLFAVPAIQSLAAAYPDAEITLAGTALAEDLLEGRAGAPHRVVRLPSIPGVGAPEDAASDPAAVDRFVAEAEQQHYDLAVQVHGGGRFSNPFLLRIGATHTVGTRTDDAAPLERSLAYTYYQHEVLRALEVVSLAGAAPVALEPQLEVLPEERRTGIRICGGQRQVVVIHPGATDPRRRWPAHRFAACARALAQSGARVVLVGDRGDADLCAEIAAEAERGLDRDVAQRITDHSGALSVRELVGVLAHADVMLGNDSGPRHLAQAVGARTVSIYWFGNLINAGPLGRSRHRVHLGWVTHCPTCGRDCTQVGWTAERCEHDDSFVADVAEEPVIRDVLELLDGAGDGS